MNERNKRQRLYSQWCEDLLIGMLAASLLVLTGCGLLNKEMIIHPIEGSDIVLLKQGETIVAPKQGAFLSDFYIKEIMEAKVR